MLLKQRKLVFTSLISIAIIGSLALGIVIGRAPNLVIQESEEQPREAILKKLESAAQQQAQTTPSLFDAFSSSPLGSDPFQRMQQMQLQMEQLLSGMGAGPSLFNSGSFTSISQPQIEVEESKDEYRVLIPIAKGAEIDLETELDGNTLSISAQVRTQFNDNSMGRQLSSASTSRFSRAIALDSPVNAIGMQTEKSDSQVVIRIPKLT